MRLFEARGLADKLVEAFAPGVERLEVAGSVRRRKPEVKDIEIVAIPRWDERPDSGAQMALGEPPPTRRANLLAEVVRGLDVQVIKPGTHEIVPWELKEDGRYWRLYLPKPAVKVDLFLADADTWGLTLMIRTGSGVGPDGRPETGFGPAMLARWKAITNGGYSRDARLYRPFSLTPEFVPEEADVFAACRVQWVEPRERTDRWAVERNAL